MSSDIEMAAEYAWAYICAPFDVDPEPPSLECLLCGVDLADPERAAREMLVNALTEVIQRVGRFSPWYTKPASDFGLVILPHRPSDRVEWGLTIEAEERYGGLIDDLAGAIRSEGSFAEAVQHLAPLIGVSDYSAPVIDEDGWHH